MITLACKTKFEKTTKYFDRILEAVKLSDFDKYGREGVDALKKATPKDTGKTSESWNYKIVHEKDRTKLVFTNDSISDGVPIAVILQYGHFTRQGCWVEGVDYINPALKPIFDEMVAKVNKKIQNEAGG